jgi:tRNA threonylcarbamoyl adenosine modification protein YeaZ/ribosomal-protein-alanine acetyltransferase
LTELQYPLLALDTSGSRASVALATANSLDCAVGQAHRGHSQSVLGLAQELLDGAKLESRALRSLVVVHGPGSFTGLRVAVSVAQGIALATACDVFQVNSLLVSAWQATLHDIRPDGLIVLVGLDARLGEIYSAVYRWEKNQFVALGQMKLGSAVDTLRWFEQTQVESANAVLAVGSAWTAFDALAEYANRRGLVLRADAFARADAAAIAVQFSNRGQISRLSQLEELRPVYLRDKVALNSKEQADLRWRKQFSNLRALGLNEVADLSRLEAELQVTPWSEQSFADAIASGCIVQGVGLAPDPTQLAAYFVLLQVLDETQLLTIGVGKAWQGNGLGRWMLEQAIVLSKLLGAKSMLLEVRESNAPARALYLSIGFEEVGVRKAYYATATASREDARVMRLTMQQHE